MRQIKYRAWHRQRKRMFEVRSIDFFLNQVNGVWTGSGPEETGPVNLASCRLMEFTGLCDMKGREIYEGDIVDDTTNRIGIQRKHSWWSDGMTRRRPSLSMTPEGKQYGGSPIFRR